MQNFTPGTIKEKGLCKGHCEGMSKVKRGDSKLQEATWDFHYVWFVQSLLYVI
ncbi:hypothetical protein F2Q69_00008807 [Brassica cretica]|uniref:Uncharacterized protein n=1 Tax=Brassica cretica TaxID=69181 RepID=A0A8S9NN22_BRACR|nr:hypothetical protein F2Q69_00040865 [Brassica cretica]KAF3511256.1 hypothetical protein F2Q69_00008807 [Brassica cretica]